MTLGRVTQLPTSRGQAGYRAQARLAFRRALANEVSMPLVLLGPAGKVFRLVAGFASGAPAVTALVIAECSPARHLGCRPGRHASAATPTP